MNKRYLLLESCHMSGCMGITDYYILDTQTGRVVEQCGFASFDAADAWYEEWCETHEREDDEC